LILRIWFRIRNSSKDKHRLWSTSLDRSFQPTSFEWRSVLSFGYPSSLSPAAFSRRKQWHAYVENPRDLRYFMSELFCTKALRERKKEKRRKNERTNVVARVLPRILRAA